MSEANDPRGAASGRPVLAPARLLALFAFGAVVLSIFDGFHTHSGTTRYPAPVLWQAAWWTPLLFGATAGLGGPTFALLYHAFGGRRAPPPWWQLAVAFLAFGGLWYFSGFFHGANEIKLAVLSVAAVGLYLLLDRTVAGALCAVTTALSGPLVEIVLVRAGTFEHLQPDYLGVPMWLPALYACSAPVIGHGARRFLSTGAAS